MENHIRDIELVMPDSRGSLGFRDRLPWRVRRHLEALQLASMRFFRHDNSHAICNREPVATLVAVGDVAVPDSVVRAVQQPFGTANWRAEMHAIFGDADIRTCNLETVITTHGRTRGLIGATMKTSPAALEFLCAAGFDVVTLANNHARDCRLAGLLECCSLLDDVGIRHCGAGSSTEQSRAPAMLEVAGVSVGMLGYCDNFTVDADPSENVAPPAPHDDLVVSDIASLRSRVDLVVVQLHWGWEFALHPLLSYRDRARRFAEAGADVVVCHHAHVPMGVERWHGSIVAHGLGNFVFPRDPYLVAGHPWSYRSYGLKVFFDCSGVVRAETVPCVLDADGLPRLASGTTAREILGGIGCASRRLDDDELLASVERDQTLRDATAIFARLQDSDAPTAGEWSLALRSPFRQDCIRRLYTDFGPEGEQLAKLLLDLANSAADPETMLAIMKRTGEHDMVSAVTRLLAANALPADPPGRLP